MQGDYGEKGGGEMNEILKKRIEEAAVEYAESIPQSDERKKYSREDFIAGAEYALSNQWISVEEALPQLMERVLVAYRMMDRISICIMKRIPHDSTDHNNGKWHWSLVNHKEDVIAWMPIPTFDLKLGDNKNGCLKIE